MLALFVGCWHCQLWISEWPRLWMCTPSAGTTVGHTYDRTKGRTDRGRTTGRTDRQRTQTATTEHDGTGRTGDGRRRRRDTKGWTDGGRTTTEDGADGHDGGGGQTTTQTKTTKRPAIILLRLFALDHWHEGIREALDHWHNGLVVFWMCTTSPLGH